MCRGTPVCEGEVAEQHCPELRPRTASIAEQMIEAACVEQPAPLQIYCLQAAGCAQPTLMRLNLLLSLTQIPLPWQPAGWGATGLVHLLHCHIMDAACLIACKCQTSAVEMVAFP